MILKDKVCIGCGQWFRPKTKVGITCGAPECRRERRRLNAAAWYKRNKSRHIANVVARRK